MKKLLIGVAALFALVGALLLSLPTILHEAGLPSDTSIAPMGLF